MTLSNCETSFRFLIVYTLSKAEYPKIINTISLLAQAYESTQSAKGVMHSHAEREEREQSAVKSGIPTIKAKPYASSEGQR